MRVPSAAFKINNDEMPWLADGNCRSQRLPRELGQGCSRFYQLEAEFNLIETDYVPEKHLAVFSHIDSGEPRMVLTLGLSGCSGFDGRNGEQIVFKPGQCTLTVFNSSDGWRRYQSSQALNQLRFTMTQGWIDRHFGEGTLSRFFETLTMRAVSQRPISPVAAQLARCMKDNAGVENPLFRRGLATAIVASELNDLIDAFETGSVAMLSKDKRMADTAREILEAEYADPPSLAELSRRIGTNQFKLKQLFRQHFDNTPYGMLLDIRMDKAYRMLVKGHCSVGLAAEAVGYAHASNFSAAFAKYYGFPPKNVSRRD